MTGTPELNARVRIWPAPGRHVLAGAYALEAPMLAHGQKMPKSGQVVVWDYYWIAQFREGAILLHPPPCEEHDHGEEGVDDCCHCGRTLAEAQVYDVHFAHGTDAAKADAAAADAAAKADADAALKDRAAAVKAKKEEAAKQVKAARAKLAPKAEEAPAPATPPVAAQPLPKKQDT